MEMDLLSDDKVAPAGTRLVTVFDDAETYNIKHPLQYAWCLWHRAAGGRSNEDWEASLQKIQSCDTVEDFWYIMNNIPTVEDMSPENDYHVFREGIKPAWEDPENARGGSFVINCVDRSAPIYWTNSVLACIGTQFSDYDKICGISLSKRDTRASRITLWINTTDTDTIKRVESDYLAILGDTAPSLQFRRHVVSTSPGSRHARASHGRSGRK